MPDIEFMGNRIGAPRRVEAPEGGALAEICDRYLAPIAFSCRSASCGTCHIRVLLGAEHLEPPEANELELLEILDGPNGSRLACQARVKGGPGLLRVAPVDG